jgi:hypothetical protein
MCIYFLSAYKKGIGAGMGLLGMGEDLRLHMCDFGINFIHCFFPLLK